MCGITGFIDFKKQTNDTVLKSMTDVQVHRGPDDGGYFYNNLDQAQIGLGHRRLSILDLSNHGHQPMSFKNLIMVFNGEVYNFKEIRKELESLNYTFESNSDTEVILKSYHAWGDEAVHKFNGMFAIAIYDSENKTIKLIRDRAGIKPLYWYFKDGLFLFSSELKSFHQHPEFQKELDHSSVALFMQYGYIPEPHSIFKNTYKLKAGYILELDLNTQAITQHEYWNVINYYNKPKLDISEQDAFDETEKLLSSAFEYRMVSDVPVGVFLSGGYDSTAVAAILQSNRGEKLKTYTIGFKEEKYNEAHHAKKVAGFLGTEHTEYYCEQKDALAILPKLPEIWDEPFGDASAIPTTLVSQLARKDVTVSLSADGGDEIFAGYSKHTGIQKKAAAFAKIPSPLKGTTSHVLRSKLVHKIAELSGMHNAQDRLFRFSQMLDANEQELLSLGSQSFTELELALLFKNKPEKSTTNFDCDIDQDWLSNVLATDYKTYMLDDILTKVDRATMSVSLEGREPLLDYRLIEFAAQLPNHLKLNDGNKKYLLKQIVHKYVPKDMMDRPKKGFGVPIFEWFKAELKDYLMTYLDRTRIENAGIFDADYVLNIRDRYLAGDQTNINKIWYLLMFEMWREKWM